MNDSNGTKLEHIFDLIYEKNYLIIGLYVPIFATALIANILVIWVVIKDQYMRNVTNYFLVNLSIADLLVALVCMPNAAYNAYKMTYNFGEYSCKLSAYFQCISVASSIFTITAMALDRYLAITRPFGFFSRCFNKKTTVIVIMALWTFSLLLFSPILYFTGTVNVGFNNSQDNYSFCFCKEDWTNYNDLRQALGIIWFILMFVVPGLIMLFAYSMMSRTLCSVVPPFDNNEGMSSMQQTNRLIRGRKRVACILLLLAFVFVACWLPYHVVNLLEDTQSLQPFVKKYLLLLGHANSALNPIIYCALSRKFRRSIKDLICIRITFTRQRRNMQWADSSASGTQLHYLHRLKSVPVQNQLHFALTRLQSSQKTTKTCTV